MNNPVILSANLSTCGLFVAVLIWTGNSFSFVGIPLGKETRMRSLLVKTSQRIWSR